MIKKIKSRIGKLITRSIDKMAYSLGGYQRAKIGYQDQRFPHDQYELISGTDEYKQIKNSLEIGCNQGKLVKSMANDGLFASGIDLEEYWKLHDNGKAILGVYNFNEKDVSKLPIYDAILLLSVHHQWVNKNGEEYAKNVVNNLLGKTRVCMFLLNLQQLQVNMVINKVKIFKIMMKKVLKNMLKIG